MNPTASADISKLVECLLTDMANKKSIALGFECPLFMPVPLSADDLSKGRQGEGARSMFAPVGMTVTTLGIHQAAWILRKIYQSGCSGYQFTTEFSKWPPSTNRQILLCWEAFVSNDAHSEDHVRDATTAAMFFLENEELLERVNAVTTEFPFSLIHAVALWTGWSTDMSGLHQTTLVLKPSKPYRGVINSA